MESEAPQKNRRFSPLGVLGILVSAACLWLALHGLKWSEVATALSQMSWLWCLPAALIYLVGHYLRGVRCSLIVRPHARVSAFRATQIVLIGYAANNILPARLGELVRAYALARREGIPHGTSVSTVFVERIFDGLAIVGIMAVVCLTQPVPGWARQAGMLGAVLFLGLLATLVAGRLWRSRFDLVVQFFLKPFPDGASKALEGFLTRLLDGTEVLFRGGAAIQVVLLSFVIWLVEGAMFLVLLPAFGVPAVVGVAYFALAATNLGVLLPSSPGHVGTFHFICAQALGAFGVPPATAVSYAVLVHALQYVPVTLLGIWAAYSYGFSLRGVRNLTAPQSGAEAG